jgi:hypothetical protein
VPSKSEIGTSRVLISIIRIMRRFDRRVRALLGPLVGAILLLQGLLVPMLDTGESNRRPAFHKEHDSAACLGGHDHTICIQVGANQAVASTQVRFVETRVSSTPRDAHVVPAIRSATPVRIHGPRGPPIA